MPEPDSDRIFEKFEPVIASIAYGNQAIEDDFPDESPGSGEWVISLQEASRRGTFYIIDTPLVNQEEGKRLHWAEDQGPTTQKDLLKSEEERLQELIFQVKRLTSIPYRETLANRLLALLNDSKEEDPNCLGIAVGSLQNLHDFLLLYSNLKCPTISLTPDHNIYASWRGEQGRVFSLHFLQNKDVRFVIFKPNDRHPERRIRVSGIATVDVLMETVMSYRTEEWISE